MKTSRFWALPDPVLNQSSTVPAVWLAHRATLHFKGKRYTPTDLTYEWIPPDRRPFRPAEYILYVKDTPFGYLENPIEGIEHAHRPHKGRIKP